MPAALARCERKVVLRCILVDGDDPPQDRTQEHGSEARAGLGCADWAVEHRGAGLDGALVNGQNYVEWRRGSDCIGIVKCLQGRETGIEAVAGWVFGCGIRYVDIMASDRTGCGGGVVWLFVPGNERWLYSGRIDQRF